MQVSWKQTLSLIRRSKRSGNRADFWVLLAKIAIEKAEPTKTISIRYQWGRKDTSKSCEAATGRLPNAMQGPLTFHSFFEHRLGLTLNDTVALMGAHTVGHVHTDNSKFGLIVADKSEMFRPTLGTLSHSNSTTNTSRTFLPLE